MDRDDILVLLGAEFGRRINNELTDDGAGQLVDLANSTVFAVLEDDRYDWEDGFTGPYLRRVAQAIGRVADVRSRDGFISDTDVQEAANRVFRNFLVTPICHDLPYPSE